MLPSLTNNYFELFGLPLSFRIDLKSLEKKYRDLQLLVHPDRCFEAGDRERQMSAQVAAKVNDAYRVLSNDCKRANYLLTLSGAQLDNEKNTVSDPDFLEQQMTLHEEIESSSAPDATSDALVLLADQVVLKQHEMLDQFDHAWQNKDFTRASEAVNKAQFFYRAGQRIRELMRHDN